MGACSSEERGAGTSSSITAVDESKTSGGNFNIQRQRTIQRNEENWLADEEKRMVQAVGDIVKETVRILDEQPERLVNEETVVGRANPIIPMYPINFISFADYKALGRTPRYPEDVNICRHFDSINLEETFVIFISHCWLRGWNGAAGFDGRPHPDTVNHDKYKLTGTLLPYK